MVACANCNGAGEVKRTLSLLLGKASCPTCNGQVQSQIPPCRGIQTRVKIGWLSPLRNRISRWWIFCNCRQLCCNCRNCRQLRCNCRQCVLSTTPMWGGRPGQVFPLVCFCGVDYINTNRVGSVVGSGIWGLFTIYTERSDRPWV